MVFASEVELLRTNGIDVSTLRVSNDEIPAQRKFSTNAKLALTTVWSRFGCELVAAEASNFQPDIVHFDNTFPLLSPASYSAARSTGAAVVQTLHNYRLLCPNALFFRDGRICEDCLGKTLPVPGVIHACFRDSHAQSAVVAAMLTGHRIRRTWSRDVDRYIALTSFARDKFIEGGLIAERISVKPNFVDVPQTPRRHPGNHFLFVGRIAAEKGIITLINAQKLHGQQMRLVGDGPLSAIVAEATVSSKSLVSLGRLENKYVQKEMLKARALVVPSLWYEGFPVTVVEAFASGLPVIASRLGAISEIVRDGETGLLFTPGDSEDLAEKIRWAADRPTEMEFMGKRARQVYETHYTPERNFKVLLEIYEAAIAERKRI